jgi:hypothetical protein
MPLFLKVSQIPVTDWMPTPFMHLQLSEEMRTLASHRLEFDTHLQKVLVEQWPAFYLGSVAPDFETICGLQRKETHFYTMPPKSKQAAQRHMLSLYPQIYPGQSLKPDQALFIAAYLTHLQLDLIWHFDVVLPYFINNSVFEDRHQTYFLHLTFLTYLDNLAFQSLPSSSADVLAVAEYNHWLPFAEKEQVNAWRAFLLEQMAPGKITQTRHIFAGRLGMTEREFSAKLGDPDWMKEELFSRIPLEKIQRRLLESVPESLDLIEAYWYGRLEGS